MTTALPATLSAPATRALANAGIRNLDDLTRWTEPDLVALHGVGPTAVDALRRALAGVGKSFKGGRSAPPGPSAGSAAVDAYLADLAAAPRAALDAVRDTLRSILPHATQGMKYGVPAFVLDGKAVAGYGAFKDHCGYFPMSGSVLAAAGKAVAGYETTKGGIRFGFDERLPVGLVRRLVRLRMAELASVDDGRRVEYYDDGQVKAVGPMRDGWLHGRWKWFRRDGTLMRSGQFADGEQTGTWTTWDRAGTATKVTRF